MNSATLAILFLVLVGLALVCASFARRLADWDGGAMSPKQVAAIDYAVRIAEKILPRIVSPSWQIRAMSYAQCVKSLALAR